WNPTLQKNKGWVSVRPVYANYVRCNTAEVTIMSRVNFLALAVIAEIAFFASSIWYSPLLFGRQFLELRDTTASPHPSALNAPCELLRTFVLAYVIARLVPRLNVTDW